MSAQEKTLYDEIQKLRARYPVSRSATLPALRLAQERYGWLSPEAFREVADALDETPAYCMSVASFYDMYHLEPVGRHLVEVCTNVSCALVGAQQVLEAFQSESGSMRARRPRTARSTLRTVECAGGCGWGDGRRGRPPVPRARARRGRAGDRRGATWQPSSYVVLAGAEEKALLKLADYREAGGFAALETGAR